MYIPNGAIIPLFIISFIVLTVQYYRLNPDRRLFNLQFGMMFGAVVLVIANVMLTGGILSLIFFVLGLAWLGISLFLLRYMPPPRI